MASDEARLLHLSDAMRATEAKRLEQLFELHLGSASPALANAVAKAASALGASTVQIVSAAVIAAFEPSDPMQAVRTFDLLRHAARVAPRQDALVGHALVAALAAVLGDDFQGAAREAWSNGYIRLVEIVMAGRSNRFERIA